MALTILAALPACCDSGLDTGLVLVVSCGSFGPGVKRRQDGNGGSQQCLEGALMQFEMSLDALQARRLFGGAVELSVAPIGVPLAAACGHHVLAARHALRRFPTMIFDHLIDDVVVDRR